MAPATLWAAAWLLDGGDAPWLSSADRSRLRARLRANAELTMECWLGWARSRADVMQLRADDTAQADLLSDSRIRLGGVSAAPRVGLDLVAAGQSEVYIAQGDLEAVTDEYMLLPSARSNVILHIVPGPWHLGMHEPADTGRPVPRAIVVADLFEAGDARSRRAAQTLLTAVNADARCGV
jgi:hypothetical protein